MWWAGKTALVLLGHPRPLVCGLTALNQLKPTQMAIPLQMDTNPSTVDRCNMERAQRKLQSAFKGVDLES
jgi:hypothetical protein